MSIREDSIASIIASQLSSTERERGVAYVLEETVSSGATLEFPRSSISVPWDARLAFVDREPLANWGHACRYILIDLATGAVRSVEARFPPFRRDDERRWRVVYRAPGVPDSALAVPEG
jgi:hypothetical protein